MTSTDTRHETRTESPVEDRPVVGRRTWSPAQFVAGGIGLLLVVMGGVALARLLPVQSLTGDSVTVLWVGHTPLMAVIAVAFGVLFLAQVTMPWEVQPGLITLGVILLAFGMIVIIEPAAFDNALGLGEGGGWFYAVIGGFAILSGVVSPTITRTFTTR